MKPHKTQWYLQRIREEFPRLKWTDYRRVQTHSRPDHVMFLLDNGIAFRFENDVEDEDTDLARERAVLDLIRPRLSDIPIPDYAYVPKSSNDFAGYRTIPGTRLSPWRFQRLSKARRHSEARRLGRFPIGLCLNTDSAASANSQWPNPTPHHPAHTCLGHAPATAVR